MSDRVEKAEAVELCGMILVALEDLPERAEDFKDGIETKVLSIQEWAEKNGFVTRKQMDALENMKVAVDRWLYR